VEGTEPAQDVLLGCKDCCGRTFRAQPLSIRRRLTRRPWKVDCHAPKLQAASMQQRDVLVSSNGNDIVL
jgi:hypothetical protein